MNETKDLMSSLTNLFVASWELRCVVLDNANLSIEKYPYFNFLKGEYMSALDNTGQNVEFGYGGAGGGCDIRELIATREAYLNHCQLSEEDIIVSGNGVTGVLCSIFRYLSSVDKDRKSILIPTPVYSAIPSSAEYFGLNVVYVSSSETNDYIPNYDNFLNAYNDNVVSILLVNPSNPVCKFMRNQDIEAIIRFCKSKDIYLIIDSIFEEAPGLNVRLLPYFEIASNYNYNKLIKVKGVSKDVPHLNDLRLGWSVSRNPLVNEPLWYFNYIINSSNSKLSERIVCCDYRDRIASQTTKTYSNPERVHYQEEMTNQVAAVLSYLKRQPLVSRIIEPDCGNIIYFRFEESIKDALQVRNSEELVYWIMRNAHVMFTPSKFFFHSTEELWVRLTICLDTSTIINSLNHVFSAIGDWRSAT